MTVNGEPLPERPDGQRISGERHARLREPLETQDLDGPLLRCAGSIAYATDAAAPSRR